MIGMNQDKITEKVKDGALPRFRQSIPEETLEEVLERTSVEQAKQNADLWSKYLPGNDTAQVSDFLIKQLSMASRPEAIYVGGRFEWRGAPDQRGADAEGLAGHCQRGHRPGAGRGAGQPLTEDTGQRH